MKKLYKIRNNFINEIAEFQCEPQFIYYKLVEVLDYLWGLHIVAYMGFKFCGPIEGLLLEDNEPDRAGYKYIYNMTFDGDNCFELSIGGER